MKDNWAAANYLEYLDNIDRHKHETGITTSYEFLMDNERHGKSLDIHIHHPKRNGKPESTDMMRWIVVTTK